jgi:hypothetical protein
LGLDTAAAPSAAGTAQVLQHHTIEAFNIAVLKGSGQEVVNWCASSRKSPKDLMDGDPRAYALL